MKPGKTFSNSSSTFQQKLLKNFWFRAENISFQNSIIFRWRFFATIDLPFFYISLDSFDWQGKTSEQTELSQSVGLLVGTIKKKSKTFSSLCWQSAGLAEAFYSFGEKYLKQFLRFIQLFSPSFVTVAVFPYFLCCLHCKSTYCNIALGSFFQLLNDNFFSAILVVFYYWGENKSTKQCWSTFSI